MIPLKNLLTHRTIMFWSPGCCCCALFTFSANKNWKLYNFFWHNLYSTIHNSNLSKTEGSGVRGIFFRGGKVTFSRFFSAWNLLFPAKNFKFSILVDPKQISAVSKKWQKKKKKKKKGPMLIFINFHFNFQFPTSSLLNFPHFPLHFPFFPCPSFPGRSAKIPGEKYQGGTLPPACYATDRGSHSTNSWYNGNTRP